MMKAAQGPGVGGGGSASGMPLGTQNPGAHSPNHQMHPGILYFSVFLCFETFIYFEFFYIVIRKCSENRSKCSYLQFPFSGQSPTPSSTPVSELSPGMHYFAYLFFTSLAGDHFWTKLFVLSVATFENWTFYVLLMAGDRMNQFRSEDDSVSVTFFVI